MSIEKDIKQDKFANIYHKAHINILFTAAWLNLQVVQWLKPYKLTPQQFNVLRILRGSKPRPLSIKEITCRMIDKTSNASRLVDKLLAKGLVKKRTSSIDGRQVDVYITDKGMDCVNAASRVVEKNIVTCFDKLTVGEADEVNQLLDKLREQA